MFVCGQWMGGEGEVINSADKSECVCWQSVHPAPHPPKKTHNIQNPLSFSNLQLELRFQSLPRSKDSDDKWCKHPLFATALHAINWAINCEHIFTFMVDMWDNYTSVIQVFEWRYVFCYNFLYRYSHTVIHSLIYSYIYKLSTKYINLQNK
jgi:hypothetical protein